MPPVAEQLAFDLSDEDLPTIELGRASWAEIALDTARDGFAAKYGATVLAAPTTKGFDLVAWIAPFAVFLAALLGTILLVRHWSLGKKQVEEPASTPEMTAIRERIRRETGSEGSY